MQIALKFKPRWSCVTTGPTGQPSAGGAGNPVQATSPRLFLATIHDALELSAPTGKEDILKQQRHSVFDLTEQKMFHLKPSTTDYVLSKGAAAVPNGIVYDKWMTTQAGVLPADASAYQGLNIWCEWEQPPSNDGTVVIDIYATYTVSMKQLQE